VCCRYGSGIADRLEGAPQSFIHKRKERHGTQGNTD